MFSLSSDARRERRLSNDDRAGSWATGKARRTQRRFVRRNWRLLLGAFAIIAVPMMLTLPFIPGDFQRGLVVGAALTGAGAAVAYLVTQATGTGPTIMGATGEQWTASELRPLRKRGWKIVNHLALQKWDIDHVVVGPPGSWAIETKWSARPWLVEPPEQRVRVAAERARRNATNLRLWHPFTRAGVTEVEPLLILWGPADEEGSEAVAHRVDGVLVLRGTEGTAEWRRRVIQQPQRLTCEQVEAAFQAMDAHVRRRDARDLVDAPLPPSLARIYWQGLASVGAALAGFLLSLYSLQWIGQWLPWLVVSAVAVALGVALRDVAPARWPARGWLGGWVTSAVLIAGAVVNELV